MMTHDLKVWPPFFNSLEAGIKTFEVRKADRPFEVGDDLLLREWDPARDAYTGRTLLKHVSYILRGGKFGVEPGFVVMALS